MLLVVNSTITCGIIEDSLVDASIDILMAVALGDIEPLSHLDFLI
jgi:hypothetical protein